MADTLFAVQVLEDRDDESKSLSGTGFGGTQDVGAMEGERNGACLDGSEGSKMAGFEAFLSRQREREVRERSVAALRILFVC